MSQRKKRLENSGPEPGRSPTWEEQITGPDPSLTPEERYEWVLNRLEEAYNCFDTPRRKALLLSVVKNPVEDKQIMSATYATLSNTELNDVGYVEEIPRGLPEDAFRDALAAKMKESGVKAEQYALKALELKPSNTVAPVALFMAQINQLRHFDAFETAAKYNIDLCAKLPGEEYVPQEKRMEYDLFPEWLTSTAWRVLENECKDAEKFERYFDIHVRYRESSHYAKLLQVAVFANPEVPVSAKAVLCDDLIRYETVETVGAVNHFITLTNLLYTLSIIEDKPTLKKCIAEADALRPACWDKLGRMNRCAYYGNRLCALNQLGRYEESLAMAPDIGGEYRDNTVLYQLLHACVSLERFDLAVQYGRAAVSLGGDEMDMKSLGQAYLGKKDYARGVESLKAAIWYIKKHSDGKDSYDFMGRSVEKNIGTPIEESYAGIFKLLIQAYMDQGQYVEAEAAYREAQELVPDIHELSGLRRTLSAQQDLAEKSGEVEKQCRRLKKELTASRNTVDEYVQRMKNWSDKLVKCQMLTDDEVSDELWESAVRDKMDEVLRIAVESERASSGRFYERKLREVTKRFPKLSKPLRSYFATAEQLHANFKGNTAIDFAPVLVEYCKVVEGALWEYLLQSEDYQAHCQQWLSDSRNSKTLGGAFSIAKTCGKPLYRFRDDLEKLKKLRNDSAHVGVDRIPDVEWVRTYLWQGDLLDELTQA